MPAITPVLASLAADALALGPHWIYDTDAIARWYSGGIREFDAPRSTYHPGKRAGDQTHYGDQTLALHESLAAAGGTLDRWRDDWRAWAERARDERTSYFDAATRGALERMEAGNGGPSDSADLGGASRLAPLFAFHTDPELLVRLAREQTLLTHGDPRVADAAGFFARAGVAVRDGAGFDAAFDEAAAHPYDALPAIDLLAAAREAAEGDLLAAAEDFGPGCGVGGAFPIALMVALRHGADPARMLSVNAMLGGDSAARGLALGLLAGLRPGGSGLPDAWIHGLKCFSRVEC